MRAPREIVRQAGAVVLRGRGRGRRVLLVRSSDGVHWLFPKGRVEQGETSGRAAVRELREEAGVVGEVRAFVGLRHYRRGSRRVEVSYYFVAYRRQGASDEDREARWCTPAQARRLLSFEDLAEVLDRALARVPGASAPAHRPPAARRNP